MTNRAQILSQRLEEAFGHIPVPEPEETVYDSSGDDLEFLEVAELLGGRHWRELDADDLMYQHDALAFLSPEDFRFYLPAFVRFALLDFDAADLIPTRRDPGRPARRSPDHLADVDVTAYAAIVDGAAGQGYQLAGFVRTFDEAPSDVAQIVVEYLDATGELVLDSFDTGQVSSPGEWQRVEDVRTAPAGTRSVRVRLLATRFTEGDNDAYFDALVLRSLATATLSVDDVELYEGDSGTTGAVFTVSLSCPVDGAVTVDFVTADSTALQRWDGRWVTESFTGFEYSTRCHLDRILHADGMVTEFAYDCEGNLEREWDANHPSENRTRPPTQAYGYDVLDRLVTLTQPWTGAGGGNAVTAYAYDVQDHLVRVTDANGTVTSYVYSDRDLLTEEVSEVSGRTTFHYNEHGELIEERDARGVTVRRQVDALDRVRFVDYPDDALDITYRYDDASVPFSKGRLTAIERAGEAVTYRPDRFGRLIQDGALQYSYDRNSNRLTVVYPGGMTARYTFDFADRQSTLALEGAGSASGPLVTAASYLPSGPVARLELGNGLAEVRDFDSRYFPERITVPEVFDWAYTTDAVGNVTAVTDGLDPAGSRTYGYQDVHYFLTQGNGPWGALSWSYDKIGNRLSETRDGVTATYSYSPNASGGTSPKLAAVSESEGETRRHFYDTIGDLTMVAGDTAKTRYTYDDAKRLSQIARDAADEPPALTDLRYDGRGFLRRAELRRFPDRAAGPPSVETTATYSSEGLLHHRGHVERPDAASPRGTPVTADDVMVVYFAGRPVAHVGVGARARSSPISPPTIWARRCW